MKGGCFLSYATKPYPIKDPHKVSIDAPLNFLTPDIVHRRAQTNA